MTNYDPSTDDSRWWSKKRDVHEQVFSIATRIESEQTGRVSRLRQYQSLYEDDFRGASNSFNRQIATYNLVRGQIDTVCAKISKNEPRVQVLPSGGRYKLKKRAEQLTKFLDGQFREMDLHRKAQLVFRDACIFDGGCLKVYADPDSERIKCERVYVDEILIDDRESYYGEPRQVFHKRAVHRDVLAALYPKKRGWIMDAPPARADWLIADKQSQALIDVIESWHLPSAEGAKDGRHVICIEGATLFDETWERDEFPFVFFHWQDPVRGFWMPGLAQELWGMQAELNTHLENIRVGHKRMGRPFVWLHNASKIDDTDINNEIGAIIRGEIKPEFGQTPPMHPMVYQWTDTLRQYGSEQTGVSQAAQAGRKPDGELSGAALREVSDIETERFIIAGQRYERLFLQVAEKVLRLARQLYDDGVDITIKSRDKAFIESIQWSDVDMDDDTYDLAMFKTSGLPNRPEGRIQTAIDLAKNGMVPQDVATDIIGGIPDLDSALAKERAPRELIEKILDHMIDGGDYIPPEPTMDLMLCKQRATVMINWAELNDVEPEDVDKLRTFLADTVTMLTSAAPPAPPAPAGPPGAPPMPMTTVPPAIDPTTMDATMGANPALGMAPPEMGMAPPPM